MGKRARGKVRTLYRPVGLAEAVLILESDAKRFPPRLPEQPIFYPVLTREYAEQITRNWNAPSDAAGDAGFVTEFLLDAKYASKFQEHVVGRSAIGREYWVPAEELDQFNQHLVGPITLLSAHYGEGYVGPIPRPYLLKGRNAREQLPLLKSIYDYNGVDFIYEVRAQRLIVPLNFAYRVRTDFTDDGLPLAQKINILQEVQLAWNNPSPRPMLIGSEELQALSEEVQA